MTDAIWNVVGVMLIVFAFLVRLFWYPKWKRGGSYKHVECGYEVKDGRWQWYRR